MIELPSKKIYDAGYAVHQFDIKTNHSLFRYRDEMYEIPSGMVMVKYENGIPVARIESVRNAYEKFSRGD